MKERGIPFTGPMVQAILAGRKNMTRRLIKQTPIASGIGWNVWYSDKLEGQIGDGGFAKLHAPYQVGDHLWVREAWRAPKAWDADPPREITLHIPIRYEADGGPLNDPPGFWGRYRHARFMPRWASRITLDVTGVRCERLQDISEEDAEAEGAMPCPPDYEGECLVPDLLRPYACGFTQLWESIHGPGSWAENPWLWVYEFKRRNDI